MEKLINIGCLLLGCVASSAFFWLPSWLGAIIGFFLGMCPGFIIQDLFPRYASSDMQIIVESIIATLIGLAITIAILAFGIPLDFIGSLAINLFASKLADLTLCLCAY